LWTTELAHQWTTNKLTLWHSIIFVFQSLGVATHGLLLTPTQQQMQHSLLVVAIIPPIEGRVEEGDTYIYIYTYICMYVCMYVCTTFVYWYHFHNINMNICLICINFCLYKVASPHLMGPLVCVCVCVNEFFLSSQLPFCAWHMFFWIQSGWLNSCRKEEASYHNNNNKEICDRVKVRFERILPQEVEVGDPKLELEQSVDYVWVRKYWCKSVRHTPDHGFMWMVVPFQAFACPHSQISTGFGHPAKQPAPSFLSARVYNCLFVCLFVCWLCLPSRGYCV